MKLKLPPYLRVSYFIASRLRSGSIKGFSSLITQIAIASIAFGLSVMIVSFAIFEGFKKNIQAKIFNFGGHIQATKHDSGNSYEEVPVSTSSVLYKHATTLPGVQHIQKYARKAALLRTETEVQGVIFKGISTDYDTSSFKEMITQGRLPDFQKGDYASEIVISQRIANKLLLQLHDEVTIFFVQEPPRVRKLKIVGIYDSGIEDFDNQIVIGDIRLIQRINNWADTLVGGFEIILSDFQELEKRFFEIYDFMDYDIQIIKITDLYSSFFDWFIMLNRNVVIFTFIILCVASFNIISILLILIMERTQMIGTLKALGATNTQIRYIFIFNGLRILIKGLLIGNSLAIGLCLIQKYTHIVPLNRENYYISFVPVEIDWLSIVFFNLLTISFVALVILLPSFIITRIEPIKSIRFS
ncbi:MAG: ABC transporter permease [Cytophagales bacterium]|nr:ABC transporter permease [Cytophagales bacterium]MDW8384152.1 FtsX-like permease family protein [Flammeovirgaceae bacterium]